MWFCIVLAHTIGYGDVVPKSQAGKLFTIFYGIPAIAMITTFYVYFSRCINICIVKCITLIHKVFKIESVRNSNIKKHMLMVNVLLALSALFSIASLFTHEDYENLRYVDAI